MTAPAGSARWGLRWCRVARSMQVSELGFTPMPRRTRRRSCWPGDPGGTRLQAGALLTSVGGDLNGRPLLRRRGERSCGPLSTSAATGSSARSFRRRSWSTSAPSRSDGWMDGASTSTAVPALLVAVPLHLPLGPITVHQLGIELAWETQVEAAFLITADATLGPRSRTSRTPGSWSRCCRHQPGMDCWDSST